MTIDELLKKLRIEKEPIENSNGSYTIDLDDSNDYTRFYSRIINSNLFDEDDESSQVGIETSSIQFINDDFTLTLLGNWEVNEYKLIIRNMSKFNV